MGAERLWMESIDACYLTDFEATITAVEDDHIFLDRTLFYPLGGGQNWDTGSLNADKGKVEIIEVKGRGDVQHFVAEGHGLQVGEEVTGAIDWERRYAHMRMHTAQHLVSGIVYEMFHGTRTVGNQIHQDRSRIDFQPIKFDDEMLAEVIAEANEVIKSALPVSCEIMTRSQINQIMPPERTNMDLLPISVKELRVIRIGEKTDLCPCAGTHVKNLQEIGEIELLGKKSKGKMTQRVSYTLK